MANLPIAIVKTTGGFVFGTVLGRMLRPVTQTVGTFGTIVAEGNEHTRRQVKLRGLTRETNDVIQRMDLETTQSEALIKYGNNVAELRKQAEAMDDVGKEAAKEWQAKFPEIL